MPAVDDVWAPALETADATVRMAVAAPLESTAHDAQSEPAAAIDFGVSPFDNATPAADAPAAEQVGIASGGVGFGEIDFGAASDIPPVAEEAAAFGSEQADAVTADGSFTDSYFASQSAAASAADTPFGETVMDTPPPAAQEEDRTPAPDPAGELSFSSGDIDFGADTTGAAPVPSDAGPAEPAAPAAAPPVPEISFEAPALKEEEQEAPPLSISSRHRKSPLLSILMTILGLLVAGVAGFMAYSHLSDDPAAFKLFDKNRVPVEEGRITVRKINAVYLDQAVAGELLVISGEAVNNFTKPRAAQQLKGLVFGGDGSVLASKVAYAGNTLTNEQLLTMPLDKIEAAMNNQFGDSLINLEVQSGKAIPFVIVIVNPPKEGREFGVEAAGSTVAASK
jgi:hypothetical protein